LDNALAISGATCGLVSYGDVFTWFTSFVAIGEAESHRESCGVGCRHTSELSNIFPWAMAGTPEQQYPKSFFNNGLIIFYAAACRM